MKSMTLCCQKMLKAKRFVLYHFSAYLTPALNSIVSSNSIHHIFMKSTPLWGQKMPQSLQFVQLQIQIQVNQ